MNRQEGTHTAAGGVVEVASLPQITRASDTPLWMQLKRALTVLIRESALPENHRLPSETELCRHYSVSRTVVREALAQLVNEGLIYRHQGKGAFVQGRREDQNFVGSTVGFSGELEEKRRAVTRFILRQELMLPTPRMQRYLQIGPNEPVVVIDRVMRVEGIPRAIVRWAMLERVVPGLDSLAMQNRSLYDTLSRQYGINLVRAERWIEAVSLSKTDADLLDVPEGKAALCVESVGSNTSQEVIEYYTAHFLTDRSRLRLVVAGPV